MHALPAQSPAAPPGQIRFGPGFVQEDQPRRIEAALPPPPGPARFGDIRTVLLTGPERLFLYVSRILARA
jgi:hypothetical protein